MDLVRIENWMAAHRRSASPSRTVPLFGVGAVLVVIAAWLLYLAATYRFTGAPTCDGQAMRPGDLCSSASGDSYDYQQGVSIQESFRMALRVVGGILLGGIGAWLMSSRARAVKNRSEAMSRALYAVGAALLGATAAFLFAIGTVSATLGAVGAAVAAVRMVLAIGWKPVSVLAYYLSGLAALVVAAYLVGQAATYHPTDLYGAGLDDSVDMLVADIVNGQGRVLRLLLALVAVVVGWRLLATSFEPPPDPLPPPPPPAWHSRRMKLAQYSGAVLVTAVAAFYLTQVGTLSAVVGVALAVLLLLAVVRRAVRDPRGPRSTKLAG